MRERREAWFYCGADASRTGCRNIVDIAGLTIIRAPLGRETDRKCGLATAPTRFVLAVVELSSTSLFAVRFCGCASGRSERKSGLPVASTLLVLAVVESSPLCSE